MTPIEQVIIRWIMAVNAGMTGIVGALELAEGVDSTVIIVVMLVAAFLSSIAAFFTTEQGRTTARSINNGSRNP